MLYSLLKLAGKVVKLNPVHRHKAGNVFNIQCHCTYFCRSLKSNLKQAIIAIRNCISKQWLFPYCFIELHDCGFKKVCKGFQFCKVFVSKKLKIK